MGQIPWDSHGKPVKSPREKVGVYQSPKYNPIVSAKSNVFGRMRRQQKKKQVNICEGQIRDSGLTPTKKGVLPMN